MPSKNKKSKKIEAQPQRTKENRLFDNLVKVAEQFMAGKSYVAMSEAELFEVIRTSFAHRRKMLRRSLAGWASEGVFERAQVAETRRPEELTIEEFARLAAAR